MTNGNRMSKQQIDSTPKELVEKVKSASNRLENRMEFHKEVQKLMPRMSEKEFLTFTFEQNLNDPGYLKRAWSMYEIPFLYIHETDHYNLKYHIFLPTKSGDSNVAANLIHHHNNYLLTSYTAFGPGYPTFHFSKQIDDSDITDVKVKIEKEFHHGRGEVSMVESWEPHIVFNGGELSVTLVLWSPDKKMVTDKFRNHPLIKPFKKSLLKIIYALGLSHSVGVAPKDVLQYYVQDGKVKAVKESDFFEYYKDKVGPEVDSFYIQAICKWMQLVGYDNKEFLSSKLQDPSLPDAWKHWLTRLSTGEEIAMPYAEEEQNIPNKVMTRDQLLKACGR